MRDILSKRAAPAGTLADGDQEAYFRLSLFSAEKTRIRRRLDDLQEQQEILRKRLELVDRQIQKLQQGQGGEDGTPQFRDDDRSRWNEVELEY
ncbi:MAG: hypothetical protein K0U84_14625 [Actinomycetia bacterium]|nr:hypothetical protein [Actinomycetes bacterium]